MKCIKCGETNIAQFYPSSIKRWDYRCKKCIISYNKEYGKTHKEKYNAYMNKAMKKYYPKYYQRIKSAIFSHYSNDKMCCAECGATTKLSIDHINGNGAKHRLELGFNSSLQFYLWLKRNDYPEGYRVLCINCNSHIKSPRGRKYQSTSKLVKRAIKLGYNRAKEIADWVESPVLTRRAILEAIRRQTIKGTIRRTGKGIYELV